MYQVNPRKSLEVFQMDLAVSPWIRRQKNGGKKFQKLRMQNGYHFTTLHKKQKKCALAMLVKLFRHITVPVVDVVTFFHLEIACVVWPRNMDRGLVFSSFLHTLLSLLRSG